MSDALSATPTARDCIQTLDRLVGFDTTSRNSNLELIDYVRERIEPLGARVRLTHDENGGKANLWATFGPDGPGGIVLSGHTDVVPVDGQDWSSDPFAMEERGGRLYGRGTADMKGFVACATAHAARFAALDLKTPVHFAFSYDEEVGCVGVQGLVRDVADNLPRPAAVVVGEPTMMKLVGGNKGGRSWDVTVTGLDGHSSLPALGANAIMGAAKIIAFAEALQGELVERGDPHNGFEPHYTTIDCGVIEGGTAHNIIPAQCRFSLGFRTVPGDDADALEAELRAFIEAQVEPRLKQVNPQGGVTLRQRHDLPPFAPDETSDAEQLIRRLTGLNESGRVAYGTEAGHFQAAGMACVIFGPGDIRQAHLPDEFIAVSQMEACHDFMVKLGDHCAGNAP